MPRDGMPFHGTMRAVLRGPDGKIKDERIVKNQIQDSGDKHVADQMSEVPGDAAMGWMGIGTGNGQGAGVTVLAAHLDRNALTSWAQGAGANDDDVIYIGTWVAGDGTGVITEAGIFNNVAAGVGDMLCYADFAAINKLAADSLVITWTVTFG